MPNENCLENVCCPKCRNDKRVFIMGKSEFEVLDNGTESHGDVEWDEASPCRCPECFYMGVLGDFRNPPLKPRKRRVTIEVLGGVAYVESCPNDIEVFIKDYDDQEAADGYIAPMPRVRTSIMEDMENMKALVDKHQEVKP